MKAPVYDLLNAGPRHRFTVRGADKKPFIVSNCVQATARDVLVEAILRIESVFPGSIVLHVHDEVVCEVDMSVAPAEIEALMSGTPDWIEGLPVGSSVEEADRYFK
jgi:DNA polymerase